MKIFPGFLGGVVVYVGILSCASSRMDLSTPKKFPFPTQLRHAVLEAEDGLSPPYRIYELEGLRILPDLLETKLALQGVSVVDRRSTERILEEHSFSVSGLVETQANTQMLGKLLSADVLVFTTLTHFTQGRLLHPATGTPAKTRVGYRLRAVSVARAEILWTAQVYEEGACFLLPGRVESLAEKSLQQTLGGIFLRLQKNDPELR